MRSVVLLLAVFTIGLIVGSLAIMAVALAGLAALSVYRGF